MLPKQKQKHHQHLRSIPFLFPRSGCYIFSDAWMLRSIAQHKRMRLVLLSTMRHTRNSYYICYVLCASLAILRTHLFELRSFSHTIYYGYFISVSHGCASKHTSRIRRVWVFSLKRAKRRKKKNPAATQQENQLERMCDSALRKIDIFIWFDICYVLLLLLRSG